MPTAGSNPGRFKPDIADDASKRFKLDGVTVVIGLHTAGYHLRF